MLTPDSSLIEMTLTPVLRLIQIMLTPDFSLIEKTLDFDLNSANT